MCSRLYLQLLQAAGEAEGLAPQWPHWLGGQDMWGQSVFDHAKTFYRYQMQFERIGRRFKYSKTKLVE